MKIQTWWIYFQESSSQCWINSEQNRTWHIWKAQDMCKRLYKVLYHNWNEHISIAENVVASSLEERINTTWDSTSQKQEHQPANILGLGISRIFKNWMIKKNCIVSPVLIAIFAIAKKKHHQQGIHDWPWGWSYRIFRTMPMRMAFRYAGWFGLISPTQKWLFFVGDAGYGFFCRAT